MDEPLVYDVRPARKSFNRLGFALFVIAAVSVSLQILLSLLSTTGIWLFTQAWAKWLLTFAPLYLVAIPLGLLVMRRVPRDEAEGSRLGAGQFFLLLLMCFPLMYGGSIVGSILSSMFSGGAAENPLDSFAMDTSAWKVIVIALIGPLVEEYIFRKQLIDRSVRYGEKTAILFSALSFALFHMNLFQFFYAFALGLLFGWIYVRTRRLRYTAALHMIVNFVGSVIAPAVVSLAADEALLYEQPLRLLAVGAFGVSIIGLFIAGLVVLIRRQHSFTILPTAEELPKGEGFRTVYLRPGYLLFTLVCLAICVAALLA